MRIACFTVRYQGSPRSAAELEEYAYLPAAAKDLPAPASQAALDLAVRRGLPP